MARPNEYCVIDPRGGSRDVTVGAETVHIRHGIGSTWSKGVAQEAAGWLSAPNNRVVVVEREEPHFGRIDVAAFVLSGRCRACDEGICALASHQVVQVSP